MTKHATGDVRNLALIGGPGTGKTTFAESLLFEAGATKRLGSVRDGTTVSDFRPEEQEKQHSVEMTLLRAAHLGRLYHIIDTPGYPDYIGEPLAALSACETAVFFVDAVRGLNFPGRKVWERAVEAGKARCVVVTRVDEAKVDWQQMVATLGEVLGCRCVAVTVPDGSGSELRRVRSVPLGPDGDPDLAPWADALVEAAVEIDDACMTRFLEEDVRPTEAELCDLLVRSVVQGQIVPVFAVSAVDGRGVKEFLEYASRVLPSPADGPFPQDEEGRPVRPESSVEAAFVFKTMIDAFVGRLSLVRIASGAVHAGMSLTIARTGKPEKIAHLQSVHGKEHVDTDMVAAGDLLAIPKLESISTFDTLHGTVRAVTFAPPKLPAPMVARAIEPANHADDAKLSVALKRAAAEDPTFVYERDEATGELIVRGVSPIHIESVLRRIKERSHVEVKVEIPRVPMRETITGRAEGHYRHKKQSGGRGQFAEVFLRVAPAPRGAGLQFVDETVGGSVPRQFLPAIEKGVREVMGRGVIAGYPVVDVRVEVTDGKFHDVDSDEASFRMAGGRAFRDAFSKARPVMLEPLLDIEVAIPSRFMGAVTSDLTGRRGHISGMEALGDVQVIKARVPAREVLTYPTALRSLTQGEGSYASTMHGYDVVPAHVQQEIMSSFKPREDE